MTMIGRLCILWVLWALWLPRVVAAGGLISTEAMGLVITSVIVCAMPTVLGGEKRKFSGTRSARPARKRTRRCLGSIFSELGPSYFRRAYRMEEASFWKLHGIPLPHMIVPRSGKKKHKDGAANGIIHSSTRLSAALRYFAGGSPYDIAIAHGISHSDVFVSVWRVVDAANKCPELKIDFPADHSIQRSIAAGFESKSNAGFSSCCGAIDGILVWTEKPTPKACCLAQCGEKKFLCGRKSKFGLNMQAIVDHKGRFIDVSIKHPGATSDYLAFSTSSIIAKLDEPGFLAEGLCLFGDNAYVNTKYMATPFKGARGTEDDYNFYHSQLRITVECAFGMLVHRWGILRKAMSAKFGVGKTTALVVCLCRLHNFCIDCRLGAEESLASDTAEIVVHGGIPLERQAEGLNDKSPEQLLHGGEHFIDVPRSHLQYIQRQEQAAAGLLPRTSLYQTVLELGLKRPKPKEW